MVTKIVTHIHFLNLNITVALQLVFHTVLIGCLSHLSILVLALHKDILEEAVVVFLHLIVRDIGQV